MQPFAFVKQLWSALMQHISSLTVRVQSWFTHLPRWQQIVCASLVGIIVFTSVVSTFVAVLSHQAQSQAATSPNTLGSSLGASTTKHRPPDTGPTVTPSTKHTTIPRNLVTMKPLIVPLTPGKAISATSNNGSITLSIPASAVSAAPQSDTSAAQMMTLTYMQTTTPAAVQVTELAPPSGSSAGGSGLISFGTYQVQVLDSQGHLASHGLSVPMTLAVHYGDKELGIDLTHAFAVFNGAAPVNVVKSGPTKSVAVTHDATAHTLAVQIPADPTVHGAMAAAQVGATTSPLSAQMPMSQATPSTVISYDTYEQVADFGAPDPLNVDLNAGSLTEGIKLDVPPGPAGTLPNLTLAYNSSVVSENHSPQGTSGWVGEGWSMSLGSITWAEHNVLANTSNPEWEDQWLLTDPFGTSTELLPPTNAISTYYDDTPNTLSSEPIQWHTASETYDKIYSIQSPYQMPYPPGQSFDVYPPCFRVYRPNGVMEEFGCTADSVVYYPVPVGGVAGGNPSNGELYYPQTYLLDLITDPNGNQVHITYAGNTDTEVGPGFLNYPRDKQMATIEWDSPNCVNATTMCTGTNWTPQYRVNFVAGHSPTRLTNTPSGCNTASNVRCDDPIDLTGSGGYLAPEVMNTFVLNDIQVQINTSGTWNTLRDYQLSYEQSGPSTITDPVTGKQLSTAGMLDMTQIQEVGTDGTTAYPPTVMSYATQTEYYEDGSFYPYSTTFCGPSWNTGGNGGTCDLWSQSYNNNSRYLSSISNGEGLQQTISWVNARNNTHGSAQPANPFYCDANQTGYPCNSADDQAWSRIVVAQRDDIVDRITQAGQGGTQTITPIDTQEVYSYLLTYPLAAQECTDCTAGMYWGNQNDGDYLDYYEGKFMGFAQASITHPDGSVEIHKYYTTQGWGVYDTSKVTSCPSTLPPINTTCHASPWWNLNNAAHGLEYQAFYLGTDGTTLLKQTTANYQAVCPASGITATPTYSYTWNGNGYTFGPWDGMLVSELDHNNPVADCDVQLTQRVTYMQDGSSNGATDTEAYTYDTLGRVTQVTSSSSSGSPSQIVSAMAYVWNNNVTATSSSVTGTYLIDVPAMVATQDGSGNRVSCLYAQYDGMSSYTTGQTSNLLRADVTAQNQYTNCGTSGNSYSPSGLLQTTTAYSTSNNGDMIATNTPNANAGLSGQKNCTINGVNYSSCATYDTTTQTLPTNSTVQNLTTSTGYSSGAANGFGQWPTSMTDPNSQTATMAYDALGRATSETLPGDTSATETTTFTDWCSGTSAQTPCVEQDTTQRLNSTTTVTSRSFFDGEGHLVETRTPGENGQDVVQYALYDVMGRPVGQSVPYFVTAYTGSSGAAAFSIPDSTQAGVTATYDGLDRILSMTNALSQVTSSSFSIICGVSGFNDPGCYEQILTIDANHHQHGVLVDGFGRTTYDQSYTGNSTSTYAVYTTTVSRYDAAGRLTQVQLPSTGTETMTYDAAGRLTQQQDPDLGTVSYTYDADGNLTSSTDPRGTTGMVYYGYDNLDRKIWMSANSNGSNPLATWVYDSTTNGNMGKGRLTSETFASGPSQSVTGGYTYTYDARGNQIGETMTMGSASYPFTVTYNDATQPTSVTYPDGDVVTTNYDSIGWLSGVTEQKGSTSNTLLNNIVYSGNNGAAQLPTSASVDNGTYSWNMSYDTLLRPTETSVQQVSNGSTLFDQKLSFDAVGNVTAINTTLPAGTDNQAFCYDEQNRLVWAGSTGTPTCGSSLTPGTLTAANYTQTYAYDVHNRLTTGPMGTYWYSASQMDAVTAASNGYGAQYDAAGDMTCRQVDWSTTCSGTPTGQTMTYDQLRRMLTWQNTVSSPTQTASYAYDGEGNRVQQVSTVNGTTTTTSYILGLEEVSVTGSNTTTTKYYNAGVANVANVNGTLSYLVSDSLGSTSVALTASGGVQAASLYASYGATRYSSGTMPTAHGYTGMVSDPSGLSYDSARYYDSVVGQFTVADSVQGPNRYGYVGGNPETFIDPTGHADCGFLAIACWGEPAATAAAGIGLGTAAVAGSAFGLGALSIWLLGSVIHNPAPPAAAHTCNGTICATAVPTPTPGHSGTGSATASGGGFINGLGALIGAAITALVIATRHVPPATTTHKPTSSAAATTKQPGYTAARPLPPLAGSKPAPAAPTQTVSPTTTISLPNIVAHNYAVDDLIQEAIDNRVNSYRGESGAVIVNSVNDVKYDAAAGEASSHASRPSVIAYPGGHPFLEQCGETLCIYDAWSFPAGAAVEIYYSHFSNEEPCAGCLIAAQALATHLGAPVTIFQVLIGRRGPYVNKKNWTLNP